MCECEYVEKRMKLFLSGKAGQQIDLLLFCIDFLYFYFYCFFKIKKNIELSTRHSHNNSNPSDVEKLHKNTENRKKHIEYTFHRVFFYVII